jgi:hypothetical protein
MAEPPSTAGPPIEDIPAIPPPQAIIPVDVPVEENGDAFDQMDWNVEEPEYELDYFYDSVDGVFMY